MFVRISCPPADVIDEFLTHLPRDGPSGQQVLRAVNLRGFTQNRSAAMAHQKIHGCAQGRIGGYAGVGIGSATFKTQDKVAGGNGTSFDAVGFRKHRPNTIDAFLYRLFSPPVS